MCRCWSVQFIEIVPILFFCRVFFFVLPSQNNDVYFFSSADSAAGGKKQLYLNRPPPTSCVNQTDLILSMTILNVNFIFLFANFCFSFHAYDFSLKWNSKHYFSVTHKHTWKKNMWPRWFILCLIFSIYNFTLWIWICDGAANVPANASFVIYTDANGQVYTHNSNSCNRQSQIKTHIPSWSNNSIADKLL